MRFVRMINDDESVGDWFIDSNLKRKFRPFFTEVFLYFFLFFSKKPDLTKWKGKKRVAKWNHNCYYFELKSGWTNPNCWGSSFSIIFFYNGHWSHMNMVSPLYAFVMDRKCYSNLFFFFFAFLLFSVSCPFYGPPSQSSSGQSFFVVAFLNPFCINKKKRWNKIKLLHFVMPCLSSDSDNMYLLLLELLRLL